MRRHHRTAALLLTIIGLLPGVPRAAGEVSADLHTLATPPLAPGQIELLTTSTFPDTVTGDAVLVRIRGIGADDTLVLERNDERVPVTQAAGPDGLDVLVDGLQLGENTLRATVSGLTHGERVATLTVRNHPIDGPVISGPHQMPIRCRVAELGYGTPADPATCWVPTSYEWWAFSDESFEWTKLEDPQTYPEDTATTVVHAEDPALDGRVVPFVARMEISVINRGIARIAVLDDPASRADPFAFTPSWNGRVYHSFGQGCSVGYDQGRNYFDHVLGSPVSGNIDFDNALGLLTRLGEGDAVVHSSLTNFGNLCNPFVSIETAMMLKEHIAETYPRIDGSLGPITTYLGSGNSGGALQQYNLVNNAPGVLDAAMPATSFADITTLSMTSSDCVLFVDYFAETDVTWTEAQRAYVTGHNAQTGTSINSICGSWALGTRQTLDATQGCGGLTPEQRYHPQTNPTGSRCTVFDANRNWLGIDPATGFARRSMDNVGVQYGLRAFNQGLISFEQFADLNRHMGGFDIDGKRQPERHEMSDETAAIVYRVGQVIGRGALAETPIIDFGIYLDPINVAALNIHESARPIINRYRVRQAGGGPGTMAIWRGVVVPADGFVEIDQWMQALQRTPSSGNRIADVEAAKPLTSIDQCAVGTLGGRLDAPSTLRGPLAAPVQIAPGLPVSDAKVPMRAWVPEDHELGLGPCSQVLPPVTTTRIAAGGPAADDVIKCQRKPIDARDYLLPLSAEQLAELATIFPDGVCDYSKPSIGDVERSLIWPTLGGAEPYLDEQGNAAPRELAWRVARSS